MTIVYRDGGGYVAVKIPYDGIDFLDGKAYFTDGEKDYKINLENIVRVVNE